MSKPNTRVITITVSNRSGVTSIDAMLGEYRDDDPSLPCWPTAYLYDIKPSEYYSGLGSRIFTSTPTMFDLEYYDIYSADAPRASAMSKTLNRLGKRLSKLNDTMGYCPDWATFVLRLASIVHADILVERKSCGFPSNYSNWMKVEPRYAISTLNEIVDRFRTDLANAA